MPTCSRRLRARRVRRFRVTGEIPLHPSTDEVLCLARQCIGERGSAMDFSQDLVRGSVVPVVLALLRERPMYGYEMVKHVNARTGGRLNWREGTLYPALHRLESDGLVTAQWREARAIRGGFAGAG